MRIVQLLPAIAPGDAVSNDARQMQQCLRRWDSESAIYAENISAALPAGTALPASLLPPLERDDVLIYHMSTGSPAAARLRALSCRKVMVYHNITPAEFFVPYSRAAAELSRQGRRQLAELSGLFDYALAVSEYNRQELLAAGYDCPVDVLPVLVPFEDYRREPEPYTLEKYGDGRTNILFVGRIAPNKKQEDVIAAFADYQARFDPTARLILAGSDSGMEAYRRRLWEYVRARRLQNVKFTGHLSFPELLAYYRTAHAFLCLSQHEGFCVPLLEAMSFDVPIVARAAGAVPETLGGSGVLLPAGESGAAAEALHRLQSDAAYRREILAAQRRRLADFTGEGVQARFITLMEAFLSAPRRERMPRVVQMVPALNWGDAISNDVLALRQVFRGLGCREEVWAQSVPSSALRRDVCCAHAPLTLGADDVAVFHMGIGTDMAAQFLSLPCRKVMIYHNVTPPAFFEPYSRPMARGCRLGLQQTAKLARRVDYALADSEFNRQELEKLGCRCPTDVLPVLIPYRDYEKKPDAATLEFLRDGRHNILFVGRLVPNKKIEDVIRAFALYQARFDPAARLVLAGGDDTVPGYAARLERYIDRLGAENVALTGKISFEKLLACYRAADAFLCLSAHEGFCVPLLEAMYFDVPIVARAAGAVPYTLGESGVLLPTGEPGAAAEALHALITEPGRRAQVLSAQRARLRDFSYETVSQRAGALFTAFFRGERYG